MRYFSIVSICLLLISCGSNALENEDIAKHLLGDSGVLNSVILGDSWSDVKKLAGDYWEVVEDPNSNLYQFFKEKGPEIMMVRFELLDNKVAGIGVDITSNNVSDVAFLLYRSAIIGVYRDKFNVDIENENGGDYAYDNNSYHNSMFLQEEDDDISGLTVIVFPS